MAPEKDDRKDDRAAVSARKPADAGEDKRLPPSGSRAVPRAGANGGALPAAAKRRHQYLIGTRWMPRIQHLGFQPQSMDAVAEYLERQDDVEILTRIKPSGLQPFGPDGGWGEVMVALIEDGKAESLRAAAQPHIVIEPDALLSYADGAPNPLAGATGGATLPLSNVATPVALRIIGERDQPVAKAAVLAYGPGLPAQAVTDDAGTARLAWFGGPVEAIQAIYVRPSSKHWERLVVAPELDDNGGTTIKLRPLSETWPNFPNERLVGWGQRLMRLDQCGGTLTGAGVRIGLIDSGCDTTHPLLRHITRGKDFTNGGRESGWTDDVIAHGTHAAGIVSAAASGAQGIAGFAPEAELHVFKVFPGGRSSDLLAALDECIARELDIVNIGVCCDGMSELVSQKLVEARHRGIACIVAAGSSGGPVMFPAMVSGVLAVGAVGKVREFPSDTGHALNAIPQLVGSDGVFAARFSCFGAQIAVSAPGVAIVSTVPGGGYAAVDGTAAAAAHVSGLAALVLAHHPLLQGPARARSEQRVTALFGLIQASAVPHFADPLRGGAGVPDVLRIPGLLGAAATQPSAGVSESRRADLFGGLAAFGGAGASGGPAAWPQNWPLAGVQGWQTLMQMRAAGLI